MITMQQLEELEGRIIKALQLIGDLRSENSRLESDNEALKSQAEDARLGLEEKEQEVLRMQKELDDATRELNALKEKEEILEKKIIALLAKMDTVQGGPSTSSYQAPEKPARAASYRQAPAPKPVERDITIETVRTDSKAQSISRDEDIIIIDDEADLKGSDVVVESVRDKASGDDEIILLDEGSDEIIIDDVDAELTIIDESESKSQKKGRDKKADADEDFLIIEDESK
jgi:DNA repair exonuclease SbcCD ATPase subunit